jgi:hypothetical protein
MGEAGKCLRLLDDFRTFKIEYSDPNLKEFMVALR